MIFIILGTQKFQLNRLLKKVQLLIEQGIIKEKVAAQVGYSDYIPKGVECYKFLDKNLYNRLIEESDMVICHGGTGAIINSISKGKKVIAVPRLKVYGEHVDDHQVEIVNEFYNMNYIEKIENIDELDNKLAVIKDLSFRTYTSNTENIIEAIDDFINSSLLKDEGGK